MKYNLLSDSNTRLIGIYSTKIAKNVEFVVRTIAKYRVLGREPRAVTYIRGLGGQKGRVRDPVVAGRRGFSHNRVHTTTKHVLYVCNKSRWCIIIINVRSPFVRKYVCTWLLKYR